MIPSMVKKCSWCNADAGLLVLRIGVAIVFIFAGWMKLADMASTVGYFSSMGLGAFWAWLVAIVELVGGIAVLLGICTRMAATLLTVVMIVATILVGMSGNVSMLMTPVALLFANLALTLAGGGRFSLVAKMCGCSGKCVVCQASDVPRG